MPSQNIAYQLKVTILLAHNSNNMDYDYQLVPCMLCTMKDGRGVPVQHLLSVAEARYRRLQAIHRQEMIEAGDLAWELAQRMKKIERADAKAKDFYPLALVAKQVEYDEKEIFINDKSHEPTTQE
jgi:hypothetical protein